MSIALADHTLPYGKARLDAGFFLPTVRWYSAPMNKRPSLTNPAFEAAFLEHLRTTANVTATCKDLGILTSAVYSRREADPLFAERMRDAMRDAISLLEFNAQDRAFKGVLEPVFFKGEVCGHIRRYSDTLTMFLLKAHDPERHRERSEVAQTNINMNLTPDQRASKVKALLDSVRKRQQELDDLA